MTAFSRWRIAGKYIARLPGMHEIPFLRTRAGAPCYGNVDYASPMDHRAWMNGADKNTLVVVHVETQQGFENFDEIVSTPDISMVYVGPYDFSISVGYPGEYDHPEVKRLAVRAHRTRRVAEHRDTAGQWKRRRPESVRRERRTQFRRRRHPAPLRAPRR